MSHVEILLKQLKEAEEKLMSYPAGTLVIHKGKYGGHQYRINKKRREDYIPKKDLPHWIELFDQKRKLKEQIRQYQKELKPYKKEIRLILKRWQAQKKVAIRPYPENLRHYTLHGEYVRSKSELLLADYCYLKGIHYEYERPLQLGNTTIYPDFTIFLPYGEVYLEHLGRLEDPRYAARWKAKLDQYAQYGIYEGVNLICTREYNGNINMQEINKQIQDILF